MGFLDALGFGKKRKVNLAPDIEYPLQTDLYFTKPFRERGMAAFQAAQGKDVPGFGFEDEFVDRATNPVIQDRIQRLTRDEIPQLTAQQAARGITRSTPATAQIQRAQQQAQGDIDKLLSNFYVLNQQQRKTDIGQGLDIAQNMQTQQENMMNKRAAASEALVGRTSAVAEKRNAEDQAMKQATIGALMAAATGGLSALGGGGAGIPMLGGGVSTGKKLPGGIPITTFTNQYAPTGFAGMSTAPQLNQFLSQYSTNQLSQLSKQGMYDFIVNMFKQSGPSSNIAI